MTISTGVAKVVAFKKEVTWGTAAGAAGAQIIRRTQSNLSLKKATYQSNELRSDYQIADFRHGVRSVAGSVDGELSPGTYEAFMAAMLRKAFTAITAVTGLTLTFTGTGPTYTVTATAGPSFLTAGFKVGTVVRETAATGATIRNRNLFIVAIASATVMTVIPLNGVSASTPFTLEGPTAACTLTAPGMKNYIPLTGFTDDSFSIEHWFADVAQSELFLGCQTTKMDLALPTSGMATIKTEFLGRDVQTATAQYYTTPTVATTAGVLAAVNGAMMFNGAVVALLTGLTLSLNGNQSAEAVVGANVYPDIQAGSVVITGQMTALFTDATFRDAFLNESEVAIAFAFTTNNTPGADFLSFSLPRVKCGGADKSDSMKAVIQTIPFTALLPINGGSGFDHEQSTIAIHDSLAV